MPGGNTRTVLHTSPFPLTVASGEGCKLRTIDGHEYVDFLGEYTAGIYGHNHPVIRNAIEQALDRGWNYGGHNLNEKKLAEIVCKRFPYMEKVRFLNSGTEANMIALATAVVVTGKKKILVFNKGYHGSTISGRMATGQSSINLPHDFVVGKYNDVSGTQALVKTLPADSLAAILVEPMLGSGGCFRGTREFLSSLRKLATKQKALLIFDEVMTSRLSYHGLGHHMSIQPDLMTLGKWVGGGMTFGAFGGREEIMKIYDPRQGNLEHAGTFNNNVFSMSAGIAGCTLLDENMLNELNFKGEALHKQINAVFRWANINGEIPTAPVSDDMHSATHPHRPPKMFVSGRGSLMTIHFAGPDRDMLQALFYMHMIERGIWIAARGFIALSIEIHTTHAQQFILALTEFCEKYGDHLKWKIV
jgi:glutamate-1-semialdehyde 2,1-aminomutase